jgi:hypothetical protein
MAEPIIERAAIILDAQTAAARYLETGCEQHSPHLTDSAADLLWREVYAWAIEPAKQSGLA